MSDITAAEKIRILLNRSNMSLCDLAEKTGQSAANISSKLARNDLKESQIRRLADALGYDVEITFKNRTTGSQT